MRGSVKSPIRTSTPGRLCRPRAFSSGAQPGAVLAASRFTDRDVKRCHDAVFSFGNRSGLRPGDPDDGDADACAGSDVCAGTNACPGVGVFVGEPGSYAELLERYTMLEVECFVLRERLVEAEASAAAANAQLDASRRRGATVIDRPPAAGVPPPPSAPPPPVGEAISALDSLSCSECESLRVLVSELQAELRASRGSLRWDEEETEEPSTARTEAGAEVELGMSARVVGLPQGVAAGDSNPTQGTPPKLAAAGNAPPPSTTTASASSRCRKVATSATGGATVMMPGDPSGAPCSAPIGTPCTAPGSAIATSTAKPQLTRRPSATLVSFGTRDVLRLSAPVAPPEPRVPLPLASVAPPSFVSTPPPTHPSAGTSISKGPPAKVPPLAPSPVSTFADPVDSRRESAPVAAFSEVCRRESAPPAPQGNPMTRQACGSSSFSPAAPATGIASCPRSSPHVPVFPSAVSPTLTTKPAPVPASGFVPAASYSPQSSSPRVTVASVAVRREPQHYAVLRRATLPSCRSPPVSPTATPASPAWSVPPASLQAMAFREGQMIKL